MHRHVLRYLRGLVPGALYGGIAITWLLGIAYMIYAEWVNPAARISAGMASFLTGALLVMTLIGVVNLFAAARVMRDEERDAEAVTTESTDDQQQDTAQILRPVSPPVVVMPDQRTVPLHTLQARNIGRAPLPTVDERTQPFRVAVASASTMTALRESEPARDAQPAPSPAALHAATELPAPQLDPDTDLDRQQERMAWYAEGWHDRDRLDKNAGPDSAPDE